MERIVTFSTVRDGYHVFGLVREDVAQSIKLGIASHQKAARLDPNKIKRLSYSEIKAIWIEKSIKIVNSGRELVAECAWEKYSIVEHFLL